jgi:hypothetical protein
MWNLLRTFLVHPIFNYRLDCSHNIEKYLFYNAIESRMTLLSLIST